MTSEFGSRKLPQNPHMDYLRKEAKHHFSQLRQKATGTRLADAQYWLAREYGFSNWRALKDEVLRRMGLVRMAQHPGCHPKRFQVRPSSVDDELEVDFFFQRGAAVMSIGVIAALVIVVFVILMILSGRALGQTPPDVAQRLAEQALPRTAISLAPEQFDKFVGFYQLGKKAVVSVTRDGDHYFIRASNQPTVEVFPESETKFFLKVVPAQIRFMMDPQGNVTGAVLHQGGREMPLPRIDEAQAEAIAALPKGHPTARTWPVMENAAPRFLTKGDGGTLDYWPSFSPDGNTILFSRSNDRGRTWALYRVPSSGGTPEEFGQLPITVIATRADWSKNNTIAFTGTTPDRHNGIWIINGDGTDAHPIKATDTSDGLVYPSWYPDGKSVAVMDEEDLIERRLDLTNGVTAPLTDHNQVMTGMPSVSPDGKWVAFAGQKNAGQRYDQEENVIWLASGSTNSVPLEAPPLQGRAPVWSPDGKQLAFESDRGNSDGHYAVFIINRDGSGLTQVTNFALDATHPVFSRNGRHLVFAYGQPNSKTSGIAILDLR
jgi:Tol biopolymer transport system component